MALREPFMVHTVQGATAVTLTPPEGEAYLVKNVILDTFGNNYCTLKTDRSTVFYARAGMTLGNHLAFPYGMLNHAHALEIIAGALADHAEFQKLKNAGGQTGAPAMYVGADDAGQASAEYVQLKKVARPYHPTILEYLARRGLFKGFPVPSGKTFKLNETPGASSTVVVVYEVWDARDIRPDMPCGPEALEYIYLNYGTTGGTINTAGPHELDTSDTPTEFPAFPFGADVPANTEIDLLGILASDVQLGEATGAAYAATKYLKLQRERTVLHDKSASGLPYIAGTGEAAADYDRIGAGFSLGGNLSDVDAREPLMFAPPLQFKAGEELKVSWELAVAGAPTGLLVADQQVAFIQRVRRR